MFTFVASVFTLLLTAVVLGNGFVIVTVMRHEKLRKVSRHVFVCGLALSNVFKGLVQIMANIAFMTDRRFYLGFCVLLFTQTFSYWATFMYIGSLFVMVLEQFLSVRAAIWHRIHLNFTGAALRLWLLSWFLTTLIFLALKALTIDLEAVMAGISWNPSVTNQLKMNDDTFTNTYNDSHYFQTDTDLFQQSTDNNIITDTELLENAVTETWQIVNTEVESSQSATKYERNLELSETTDLSTVAVSLIQHHVDCTLTVSFQYFDLELYSYVVMGILIVTIVFQVICYVSIYNTISKKYRTLRYLKEEDRKERDNELRKLKATQAATKRFGLLLFTFTIAYLPYYILTSFEARYPFIESHPYTLYTKTLVISLRIIKLAFDPFLYTRHCKDLSRAMADLTKCCIRA